jgi:hypothetical protein
MIVLYRISREPADLFYGMMGMTRIMPTLPKFGD